MKKYILVILAAALSVGYKFYFVLLMKDSVIVIFHIQMRTYTYLKKFQN